MRSIAATAFLLFVLLAILLTPAAQVDAQAPMPPGQPTSTSVDAVLGAAMAEILAARLSWTDDFSVNTQEWRLHEALRAADSATIGSVFTLNVATPGHTLGSYWSTHDLSNALIQVDARAVGGAPAFSGLIFHRQDESNFYFLTVRNEMPTLWRMVNGSWVEVVAQQEFPHRSVAPDISNRIGVLALSPYIGVMLDGQLRAWYLDDTFTHGTAGVMIGLASDDPSATVEFDDFKVWDLTQGYVDQLRSRLPGGWFTEGPPDPMPTRPGPTPMPTQGPPDPMPTRPGPTPTPGEPDHFTYDEGSPAMLEYTRAKIEELITMAIDISELTWVPWFLERGFNEPSVNFVILRPRQFMMSRCTGEDPTTRNPTRINVGKVPNAFYCSADVGIVNGVESHGFLIFATEYLVRIFLGEEVGGRNFAFGTSLPFAIAAHEYAHHIQDELYVQLRESGVRIEEPQGSNKELIADCLGASMIASLNAADEAVGGGAQAEWLREFSADMIAGIALLGNELDRGHGTHAQREAAFRLGVESREAGLFGDDSAKMACFEAYWPEVVPHIQLDSR